MLILENLNPKGYSVYNRRLHLKEEHVRLVFTTLGHFHAISFALRDQEPQKFDKYTEGFGNLLRKFSSMCHFDEMISVRLGKINGVIDAASSDAAKKLSEFAGGLKDFFEQTYKTADKYSTLLHGDNWINNMLFKYGVSNPCITNKYKKSSMQLKF